MTTTDLADRLAAAARELQAADGTQATLDTIDRLAINLVDACEEAGISVAHSSGRVDTPAASSDVVELIDALQYQHREGPCLDAVREHEWVSSPDIGADERWPTWGPAAVEATSIRSMMCFRLFTDDDLVGALNLYARERDAFDDTALEQGLALAAHAAVAAAAAQEIDGLHVAVENRTVIGQAQGILMERYGMDADAAFSVLVRVSSTTNTKVRVIAQELVRNRELPAATAGR